MSWFSKVIIRVQAAALAVSGTLLIVALGSNNLNSILSTLALVACQCGLMWVVTATAINEPRFFKTVELDRRQGGLGSV